MLLNKTFLCAKIKKIKTTAKIQKLETKIEILLKVLQKSNSIEKKQLNPPMWLVTSLLKT